MENDFSKLPINKSKPVLVTGATGYVAGYLVKYLLESGVTVHAAVRDPSNKEKLKSLDEIAAKASGKIKYFKTDLLDQGSYAEAMKSCEIVFHTASPFTMDVNDPQKDLVDPAQLGTKNVLEEATRQGSVERVIVTSSCAAIYGDNADLSKVPNGVLTEDVWNTSSSLTHGPYSYSKTLAEKKAWEIAGKQDQWKLVTVNPSLVVGPAISKNPTSESFTIVKQMGDGSLKHGAPIMNMGCVDVRDLAYAHMAAAFLPNVEGRYIISGHNTDLFEMSQTLLSNYGENYPIPKKLMPKWIVWLLGPLINKAMTRKMVSLNIGVPWQADNSKSIEQLNIHYRPLKESMVEMFQQQIDNKVFTQS